LKKEGKVKKIIQFFKNLFKALPVIWNEGDVIYRDYLTKAFNRRYLDRIGKKRIKHFSVVAVDIADFKEYQDAHGGPAADQLLKRVVKILFESPRVTDSVIRLGERADEFIIILPATERASAERFINRINEQLSKEQAFLCHGISCWREGVAFEELIKEADDELYRNKRLRKGGKRGL